jgi:3-dehydroquinate dehydratase type I
MQQCKKLTIVNFPNKNFGATTEQTERLFLLHKAIEFGADFIDIDFGADKKFLKQFLEKGKTKIILSRHYFESTPALPRLLQLLSEMVRQPCDVVKIVTFANLEQDNDTILALIPAAKKCGKQIIAFCMGPKGKKSRIQCIKMGALLTFASLERGKESAAGQLTIDELKKEFGKSI